MVLSPEGSRLIRVRVDKDLIRESVLPVKYSLVNVEKQGLFHQLLSRAKSFTQLNLGSAVGISRGRERLEVATQAWKIVQDHEMIAWGVSGVVARVALAHLLNADMASVDVGFKVAAGVSGALLAIDRMRGYQFSGKGVLSRLFLFASAWTSEGIAEGVYQHFQPLAVAYDSLDPTIDTKVSLGTISDNNTYDFLDPRIDNQASLSDNTSISMSGGDTVYDSLDPTTDNKASLATSPTIPKVFSATTPYGIEINGSVADQTLTHNNVKWDLVSNFNDRAVTFSKMLGHPATINKVALAEKLQQAVELYARDELRFGTQPELYKLFHLSNGTLSLQNLAQDPQTLKALEGLGIIN